MQETERDLCSRKDHNLRTRIHSSPTLQGRIIDQKQAPQCRANESKVMKGGSKDEKEQNRR